ncbi:MAG: hypothetical protein P9L92_08510 [Candidatus Electryonea clarkiae]|nr:hypothetical protein [Candidatus Electryonea clarkiae]MDP8286253.1 hypothetical protein [Candidatus Electryonea clarkiae]
MTDNYQIQESDPDSMRILEGGGIPFEIAGPNETNYILVRYESTNPTQLRNLGFKLGRGVGDAKYILYLGGRFCGVVI